MPVLGVIVKSQHLGDIRFPDHDIETLRRLAAKKAELSQRPDMAEKRRLWIAHNDLRDTRPLIFCDPENGWNEIITDYACETPLARQYEEFLRKEIFWGERMGDDRVVEPVINVPYIYEESSCGLPVEILGGENGGAFTWKPPLDDWSKLNSLKPATIKVDWARSETLCELMRHTFDGILEVRRHTDWWWSLGMTREAIYLRGMEDFFFDLVDYPEKVHALMRFLHDSNAAKLDFLTENRLLSANANDCYVGSGGFGYTDALAACGPDGSVTPANMWGFCESQETVSVSTEMFEEFVFPYQLDLLKRFGLNCYGCCEPIDRRWRAVSQIPRLRRVSVSAWADKRKMADYLGKNYIYSYKPRPAPLATHEMDEASARAELAEIFEAARGCHMEIIMKDNHTLGKNPENVIRWCRMARDLAEKAR